MTSRERILAAIDHRHPDRVPVDLGSTPSSGISAIAYGNLKTHLGMTHGASRVYDVVQQLAQPEDATFFDQTYFPYVDGYPTDFSGLPAEMGRILWAALVHSPWDHAGDPGFWDTLRARVIELRRTSDRALMIVVGCNLFEWGTFLRRMDNFLIDLVAEPAKVEAVLDALMERHMAALEQTCRAVGDVADILRFGDDLGTNGWPFMSPRIYRQLFKPRHAMLCDYVHRHSGMRTFLHSCGSIRALLPDLIDAGYDVINPVQTDCKGMDAEGLKADFGKDICFWGGGCDTRHVLPQGTPQDVKDHVKRRLDVFMPGGGFVFNTIHNILPEAPPRNIVAMYEAIEEYGA
jgi:uroporphyrinogen decarboxylase